MSIDEIKHHIADGNWKNSVDRKIKIRAAHLRELIVNIDQNSQLPEKGIKIFGATIVGNLDLCCCNIRLPLTLENCTILGEVDLSSATTKDIVLKGSSVERLNFNDIDCNGNIILSYGFSTLHPVWAMGATISGQLGCSGGRFSGYPIAMNLEAAKICGAFFWRLIDGFWGFLDLTNASIGTLADDPNSWPRKGCLQLDGLTYEHIASNTSLSYFDRYEWLMCQVEPHLTYDFRPQPFEQIASVLDKSGRNEEAKTIRIKKLHHQRNANYLRRNPKLLKLLDVRRLEHNGFNRLILDTMIEVERGSFFKKPFREMSALLRWLLAYCFWLLAGYGYKPSRCLVWAALIIVLASFMFSSQYASGNVVPVNSSNASMVWNTATALSPDEPYNIFFNELPDYPRFHPVGYAIDSFVPLVDLKQEKYWVAIGQRGNELFYLPFMWLYTLTGWLLSAIFAASVGGVIRK